MFIADVFCLIARTVLSGLCVALPLTIYVCVRGFSWAIRQKDPALAGGLLWGLLAYSTSLGLALYGLAKIS